MMNLAPHNATTDLGNDTNPIVKLLPFDESILLDSLISKKHFVLLASQNVNELADDNGHLIASQIRSYTPKKILQIFDEIGGTDVPFYTTKLTSYVIPVYTLEQLVSKPVMSCMVTFDEVEFDGINQQISHIAKLLNIHSGTEARQFINNMQNLGFPTKCTFELNIGTTYRGKKPSANSKCFKWQVDILPSGQAVFVVGLFDNPKTERFLQKIQLAVSFDKLIDMVLSSQ